MKFTEEELRRAAVRVQQRQLAMLPPSEACTDRFSPAYARKMEQLMLDLERGNLRQAVAPMGWPYYLRRSVAAVLLCFLLACVAMPDAVMAGCQRILDAVEKVYEIYTEYLYHSQVTGDTEFTPLEPTYLPEGMEEVMREEKVDNVDLLYMDEERQQYLSMWQRFLTKQNSTTSIIDSEHADLEIAYLGAEEVKLYFKNNKIIFMWLHDSYKIEGKTNLSKDELLQILRSVK